MGSDAPLIPMVKADAYGLGVSGAVSALEPIDPWGYGVATVEEGARLRELDVRRPVLVCGPIPPGSYGEALERRLTVSLSDLASLERLESASVRRSSGDPAPFHIEVDTGMGRSGFDWRQAGEWGPVVASTHGRAIGWQGCFTHLHSADVSDPASVLVQCQRFQDALKALDLPAGDFLIHVANSAGALRVGRELGAWGVRPGIFLYGGSAGEDLPTPESVACVRARVVLVRDAPPGTTLGYGSTHVAAGWERWATLGIGYGDGLPRVLGNRGAAVLRGRRVPIIGRISMDTTVVNISKVDGVEVGDVATLVGDDGAERITVDELAELAGTIGYEILTGLGSRLPRVWIDDGGA